MRERQRLVVSARVAANIALSLGHFCPVRRFVNAPTKGAGALVRTLSQAPRDRKEINRRRRRYELTEREWTIIAPLLPCKPRGVRRVDDRMVLNGILWRFRTGTSWSEIPERYDIATTCYNRFVRWRRVRVWDRLLEAVSQAYDDYIVMIDSTCVRVHQHGVTGKINATS